MKTKAFWVMALAVVFALASTMSAQVRTGNIVGFVTDETGEGLPGVAVTADSPILVGTRSVVTDVTGRYQLRGLPPGIYVLTAAIGGFDTLTRSNIEVNVGAVLRLDLSLKPTTEEREVVVVAPAPVIQIEKTTMDTVITTKILESVPILGRNFMDAIKILPGVTSSNYGVSISGGRDTQKNYNIDGSDNIDIVQGQAMSGGGYGLSMNRPFMEFDQEAIQELSVGAGGYTADQGFGSGGTINVVTKSGSNAFSGSAYIYARNDKWDYQVPYPYKNYIFGGSLGGPIIKDKLTFFMSHRPSYSDTGFDTRSSLYAGLPDDLTSTSKGYIGFFKLTWLVSQNNTLNITANVPWGTSESPVTLWRTPGDYPFVTYKNDGMSVTLADTAILSQNMFLDSIVSYGQTRNEMIGDPDQNPGLIIDLGTWIATGVWNGDELFKRTKFNWSEKLTIFADGFAGRHTIQAGIDVRYNRSDDQREKTINGYIYPAWYGLPYNLQLTILDPYELTLSQTQYGGFISDTWQPVDNLTLNLGVRVSKNTYLTETLFEPRFGLSYDPFKDGKTVIRAGANIYRDRINSYVQQFDNYPMSRYEYHNWDGTISRSDELYRRTVVDPDIVHPRTSELLIGFDREIVTDLSFSARYIYRKYDDQFFSRHINLLDPVTGLRDDPTKTALTYYSNSGYADYQGLQFTFDKRFSHRYQFMISYNYQVSKGNSQLFTDFSQLQRIFRAASLFKGDTQAADLYGKTAFDKPYDVKFFGSVVLPLDIILAGVFMYTAGSPYTEYNGQTRVMVSEYQELRSPDTMNIDLRIEKAFRIKTTTTRVMVEAFNLTNRENVTEIMADVTSADYGMPYRIGASRRVQAGFRFEW